MITKLLCQVQRKAIKRAEYGPRQFGSGPETCQILQFSEIQKVSNHDKKMSLKVRKTKCYVSLSRNSYPVSLEGNLVTWGRANGKLKSFYHIFYFEVLRLR